MSRPLLWSGTLCTHVHCSLWQPQPSSTTLRTSSIDITRNDSAKARMLVLSRPLAAAAGAQSLIFVRSAGSLLSCTRSAEQMERKKGWTEEAGDHTLPPDFDESVSDLDEGTLVALFRSAMLKYAPAIVRDHQDARDALLKSFVAREPSLEGGSEGFRFSDDMLMDILMECEEMPPKYFRHMLYEGNELHARTLLRSAAQLDESFMLRVQNVWRLGASPVNDTLTLLTKVRRGACALTTRHSGCCATGRVMSSIAEGDGEGLTAHLAAAPGLVNSRSVEGRCPLHCIVAKEDEALLQVLLQWVADFQSANEEGSLSLRVDCVDAYSNTPLHYAAEKGNAEIAKVLLERGASVNAQNRSKSEYVSGKWGVKAADGVIPLLPEHQTPLHIAAEQCDTEMLSLLLEHGPDLEIPDHHGSTPLHLAVEQADEDCVEILLEKGASAESQPPSLGEGVTLLHSACSRGLARIAELLLEAAPQLLEQPDEKGWRPLHLAARRGSIKAVKMLLNKGADVHARTAAGQTSQQLEEANKRSAIVELLQTKADSAVEKTNK